MKGGEVGEVILGGCAFDVMLLGRSEGWILRVTCGFGRNETIMMNDNTSGYNREEICHFDMGFASLRDCGRLETHMWW